MRDETVSRLYSAFMSGVTGFQPWSEGSQVANFIVLHGGSENALIFLFKAFTGQTTL